MTAIENVVVAASIANKSKGHEAKEQATALLSSLGLDSDTIRRPISQISGGQQQRTAIARALIKNPAYILADEPTGNLDKENAQVIMGILVDLAHKQNKCIIIATHSDLVCAHADVTIKWRTASCLWRENNDIRAPLMADDSPKNATLGISVSAGFLPLFAGDHKQLFWEYRCVLSALRGI